MNLEIVLTILGSGLALAISATVFLMLRTAVEIGRAREFNKMGKENIEFMQQYQDVAWDSELRHYIETEGTE